MARSRWGSLVACAAALSCLSFTDAADTVYDLPGTDSIYVVPPGVYSINVTVAGASGFGVAGAARGGRGALVKATLAVKPGMAFQIAIGTAGVSGTSKVGTYDTYGGFRGGGGGSEIRWKRNDQFKRPCALEMYCYGTERVIIAGGGGGAGLGLVGDGGIQPDGGDAGCEAGSPGVAARTTAGGIFGAATGGGGGTQSAHGLGGVTNNTGLQFDPAGPGSSSEGGKGYPIPGGSSGGGGFGWRSGGGGGATMELVSQNLVANGVAGGGGGSSGYTASLNMVTNYQCTPASRDGDGYVIIHENNSPAVHRYSYTGAPQLFSVTSKWTSRFMGRIGAGAPRGSPQPSGTSKNLYINKMSLPYKEVVQVNIGGPGWDYQPKCYGSICLQAMQGGWNGGGSAAAPYSQVPLAGVGGGGSSDIRRCANPPYCGIEHRIAVAGAAGGAGVDGFSGGDGGWNTAYAPTRNGFGCSQSGKVCVNGGTRSAGGGKQPPTSTTAQDGALFWGGNATGPGAGGGSGYYGGGGASNDQGGAGGSSYFSTTFMPGGPHDNYAYTNGVDGSGSLFGGAFFFYFPFAITHKPTLVTNVSATINVTLHDQGTPAIGFVYISDTESNVVSYDAHDDYRYNSQPPYVDDTSRYYINGGQAFEAILGWRNGQVVIPDLTEATTYYYRSCAVSAAGGQCGEVMSFRTLATGAPMFTQWTDKIRILVNTPLTPSYRFIAVEPTYGVDTYGLDTDTYPPSLPPGMTFNPSTATLSGTPTAVGTYNMTVFANNTRGYTLTPSTTIIQVFPPTLTWLTYIPTPSEGAVGRPYTFEFSAVTTPLDDGLRYNVTSGTVPPGLELEADTGLLKGTPTLGGTYTFTVRASNGYSSGNAPGPSVLSILGLPVFTQQTPRTRLRQGGYYSYSYVAITTPSSSMTYSRWSGSILPPGMTVSSSGVLSGTPTAAGDYNVTIVAENSVGTTLSFTSLITVYLQGPPIFNVTRMARNGTVGVEFPPGLFTAYDIPATGDITFFVGEGGLPSGLKLNSTSGEISGTPRAAGRFRFRIEARNIAGSTLSNVTEVVIANVPVVPTPLANVAPLPEAEPRLKLDISLVGGDEDDLRQGSGELLREALRALGNNSNLEPVYTRLSVANLTTPVTALTSLGNQTRPVNGTIGPARIIDVPAQDPQLNRPLSQRRSRRLAGGCQPVSLNTASGVITVPTTNASVAMTLSPSFYAQNNAVTADQKTALLAVVQQQFALALSGNSSSLISTPEVQEFVNAYSACTGVPPAIGIFAAFSTPVVGFGVTEPASDSSSSNVGAIAGGIIGGLAGLFLLCLAIYLFRTSRHCCPTYHIGLAKRHQCFTNFACHIIPDFLPGGAVGKPVSVEVCEHTTLAEMVRAVVSAVGPYDEIKKHGAIVVGNGSDGQKTAVSGKVLSVADSGEKELGALGFTRDNGAANTTHSLIVFTGKPAFSTVVPVPSPGASGTKPKTY